MSPPDPLDRATNYVLSASDSSVIFGSSKHRSSGEGTGDVAVCFAAMYVAAINQDVI